MKFTLIPVLDQMEAFYALPRTKARFEKYLYYLQGNQKEDLILPIAGFNPMGRESILVKLRTLKSLATEQLIESLLTSINGDLKEKENNHQEIKVVVNLVDDIGGAWSNFHTTDYSSKFDIAPLIDRHFCTPYFWTSEEYSEEKIIQRTKATIYRTLYWIENGKPNRLKDFVAQEKYVFEKSAASNRTLNRLHNPEIEKFYLEHINSEDYNLIFNFFYGDEASQSLGYKTYGISKNQGFEYAKYVNIDD